MSVRKGEGGGELENCPEAGPPQVSHKPLPWSLISPWLVAAPGQALFSV